MKVEQENFLVASLRSVQRRRRRSGTRVDIACAKSAFMTSASNRSSPAAVRTPTARRPSNSTSCTGAAMRKRTPISRAMRAMADITAPQPPRGWNTPNSYSMNDRMVNRLGQRNGDMPRYLDWNENASRTRSSPK